MSTIARVLVVAWLVAALVVLGMDGRLPAFLAVVGPSSLVVLGLGAVVRHQLAPSRYNRPSLPERYRVADDLDARATIRRTLSRLDPDAVAGAIGVWLADRDRDRG